MDEDATDAACAQQEQCERREREDAAIRSARHAQTDLRNMIREFDRTYIYTRTEA